MAKGASITLKEHLQTSTIINYVCRLPKGNQIINTESLPLSVVRRSNLIINTSPRLGECWSYFCRWWKCKYFPLTLYHSAIKYLSRHVLVDQLILVVGIAVLVRSPWKERCFVLCHGKQPDRVILSSVIYTKKSYTCNIWILELPGQVSVCPCVKIVQQLDCYISAFSSTFTILAWAIFSLLFHWIRKSIFLHLDYWLLPEREGVGVGGVGEIGR